MPRINAMKDTSILRDYGPGRAKLHGDRRWHHPWGASGVICPDGRRRVCRTNADASEWMCHYDNKIFYGEITEFVGDDGQPDMRFTGLTNLDRVVTHPYRVRDFLLDLPVDRVLSWSPLQILMHTLNDGRKLFIQDQHVCTYRGECVPISPWLRHVAQYISEHGFYKPGEIVEVIEGVEHDA